MFFNICNNVLNVEVKSYGAELSKILKDETEYLWQGNENYWTGQAPILFPIVGKLKSGVMPQHGFGRRSEFSIVEERNDFLSFKLNYNEDTLKVYPYKFSLVISYELIDNSIKVTYNVENLDNKTIYFSIGAHPAFNVPLLPNEKMEDYYIKLEKKENADLYPITKDGFICKDTTEFLKDSDIIPLSSDLFINDALIFNNLESKTISILNNKNSKKVTMDFEGFPWFGIWSKNNSAPFVCLEPWFGHADFEDFNGEFKEKDGLIVLEENKTFTASYTITID
ncbi:aldose 1-epimerase family protein [Clostridium sp.]|uniref:aldose 1-epimerase family protein n=1 Tax=Clostridium sp. TaxID=1506 RepID=UPI003463D18F